MLFLCLQKHLLQKIIELISFREIILLLDGIRLEKATSLNLTPSDESEDDEDDEDDEEGIPPPEGTLTSALDSPRIWMSPSGQNIGDIYVKKISENAIAV